MKQFRVGILGATGAVGREMMKILEERDFPVAELRPIASARSVGTMLPFRGGQVQVVAASDSAFQGLDLVLGAAENDIAKQYAPAIVKAGAVFVDNSSAFRLDKDVPLVIPEINPEDVKWHKGIISNPNCTTIVSLVAINALNQISPIESIVASSYQAVSGAGAGGPIELMAEVDALSKGERYQPKVFQYQIAYNVIPQIGGEAFEGYTSEEMKMQNEGRKILHLPDLKVSCTCVRVPVVRSHSVSIVPHAAGYLRSGHRVRGPYPRRSHQRQRPEHLVLRRSGAQGRRHQHRPDRGAGHGRKATGMKSNDFISKRFAADCARQNALQILADATAA